MVFKPDAPAILFKNGLFLREEGAIVDEPIYVHDNIQFYSHHALKMTADGKVADAVMIPLLLKRGQKITLINRNSVNVNGLEIKLGFLETFLG